MGVADLNNPRMQFVFDFAHKTSSSRPLLSFAVFLSLPLCLSVFVSLSHSLSYCSILIDVRKKTSKEILLGCY